MSPDFGTETNLISPILERDPLREEKSLGKQSRRTSIVGGGPAVSIDMEGLYVPFRAAGHVSHGASYVWRINKQGYVATTIGRSFQIFDVSGLVWAVAWSVLELVEKNGN